MLHLLLLVLGYLAAFVAYRNEAAVYNDRDSGAYLRMNRTQAMISARSNSFIVAVFVILSGEVLYMAMDTIAPTVSAMDKYKITAVVIFIGIVAVVIRGIYKTK